MRDRIETINTDYEKHCRAAREIAEAHVEAKAILASVLDRALCG